ncbi:MAP/microtubule affinity-regulating kinase 3 [Rhizoclosmatium sp. JEL0117]|nr:MAP/microtubule affinity-regulating kinase 3 [Rhizoclosmatium sp. JEL0117]
MSEQSEESVPDPIVANYRLDKTIGQGTYGKVKLGIHLTTFERVAIKVIEKAQIKSSKQVARLQREIRFLKLLHHPHIVKVYDVIETDLFIYIVMEYAVGGELFDYIVANKRVKEREARSFFRMVLSAIEYCHRNGVIHRDLKPENLLLDEQKVIKIIDFGFGNNYRSDGGQLDTFCGSPFYAAPEMILGKKYTGPEVDVWSLGVILFALLCGHLPFDDDNMKELYKKIASGNYRCPDYVPQNAKHLINRLIQVDPKKRATLAEALAHPWVNEGYDAIPPSYMPTSRPVIRDVRQLNEDILGRLAAFGYTREAVEYAFADVKAQEEGRVCAVRATYFLLVEMLAREEAKVRAARRSLRGSVATVRMESWESLGGEEKSGGGERKGKVRDSISAPTKGKWWASGEDEDEKVGATQRSSVATCNPKEEEEDVPWYAPKGSVAIGKQIPTGPLAVSAAVTRSPISQIPKPVRRPGSARSSGSASTVSYSPRSAGSSVISPPTSPPLNPTIHKPPHLVMQDLVKALNSCRRGVRFWPSNAGVGTTKGWDGFTIVCEIDGGIFLDGDNLTVEGLSIVKPGSASGRGKGTGGWFSGNEQPSQVRRPVSAATDPMYQRFQDISGTGGGSETRTDKVVTFQVEVCQVENQSASRLNFKRVSGAIGVYKQCAAKLLGLVTCG